MSTSVSSLSSNFFPSAQNGFTTTLASTISSGATTVPLNSVAGYTNGEVATFIVDPSDATKKQTFTGVIDTGGVQVTSVVWTAGTNQSHTSGATVVDYATATHISQISKGILVHADQDGTLKAGAVDVAGVLANGVVTADKLASDAVTTAKILDDAVTSAKLVGIDKSNLTTDSNPYKFYVYQASNQGTTSSTWTTLNMGTEDFDTNNNVSGGTYTVPVNGFYQFNATSGTEGSPGQIQGWGVRIIKNVGTTNTTLAGSYWYDNGVSLDAATESCSCIVQLTAGETVTIQGWMAGTASMMAGRDKCHFSGFLVCRT